jgi:ligand-binding sensor domain-containing protein
MDIHLASCGRCCYFRSMGKFFPILLACFPRLLVAQDWQVYDMTTAGFPSVTVQCLAQDLEGNIWAGTDWGLCIQDGDQWTIWQNTNSALPENNIRAIAFDAQGGAWIGTLQSGLLHFDGVDWSGYSTANSPLPDDQVNAVVVDGEGRVWAGTPNGLAMKDGAIWRIYDDSPNSHAGFRFFGRHITSIAAGDDGTMAATTMNGGYACFNETEFICYTSGEHSFPDNSGYAVAFDASGDRWVGTSTAGIVRHAGPFLDALWFPYTAQNSALPDNTIRAVAVHANGTRFLGTEIAGVAVFDAQGNWSILNAGNSGLPDDQVRCLLVDRDGALWVGTWLGGLARYSPTVGVNERTGRYHGIKAWPNPFQDRVLVDAQQMLRAVEWNVVDRLGRMVANGRGANDTLLELDLGHLLVGAYVLRIVQTDSVHVIHLVKT